VDADAAVELALDTLRPGLAPDGFALRVGGWTGDATLQIVLEAKPGACLECLVPEGMLVQVIEDAIRRHDVAVQRVDLLKEGFGKAH
jgi:Fe-S cluster biogenesis protein NfuA